MPATWYQTFTARVVFVVTVAPEVSSLSVHTSFPADVTSSFHAPRFATTSRLAPGNESTRSQPEMAGEAAVTEVEALFLDQIRAAKRHIYCESQYFASRRIAEAIAARLDEPDGPEIVIINPLTAQGWLEPLAMDTARARLVETLRRRDTHGRFRLYHPFTRGGTAIYCHAKITIIDDTQLRVGSANINNRSLRLDTECDVVLDTDRHADAGLKDRILATRHDLIAEHLDVAPERVAQLVEQTGSLIETIERLRGPGRSLRLQCGYREVVHDVVVRRVGE